MEHALHTWVRINAPGSKNHGKRALVEGRLQMVRLGKPSVEIFADTQDVWVEDEATDRWPPKFAYEPRELIPLPADDEICAFWKTLFPSEGVEPPMAAAMSATAAEGSEP